MNHPVFGDIEWMPGMGWWTGRVRLEFFAGFDTEATAACADKLGVANWQRAVDDRHRQGDFSLNLVGQEGSEPSARQERAFRQFIENRDAICNAVVDAIFTLYQSNWGHWRGEAQPGKVIDSVDDLRIPEPGGRDDMRRVLRLEALNVLDVPGKNDALVGFCFACSWDAEHGLGVLTRNGKVIEIGENDITWSAPEFAGQRGAAAVSTAQRIAEQRGIAAVKRLGGAVAVDETQPGSPVVRVNLHKNKRLGDADLAMLTYLSSLRQLEIPCPLVTDAGLGALENIGKLEVLDLSGTAITDGGLRALQKLEALKTLRLAGTRVTDAGLKEIASLRSLIALHVSDTKITDAGLRELLGLTSLQHVELAGTAITDGGLGELLANLRGLITLDLQRTRVTDAGLRGVQDLRRLRHLNLSQTAVTDAALARMNGLTSLRTLKVQSTAVTESAAGALEQALPLLQVIR